MCKEPVVYVFLGSRESNEVFCTSNYKLTKERERQRELRVGKISHTTNKLFLSEPKNHGSKKNKK
jgi:hypothetical protein